jgi:hypothetical protein
MLSDSFKKPAALLDIVAITTDTLVEKGRM